MDNRGYQNQGRRVNNYQRNDGYNHMRRDGQPYRNQAGPQGYRMPQENFTYNQPPPAQVPAFQDEPPDVPVTDNSG